MSHDPARTTNEINTTRIDGEFVRNKLKFKNIQAKSEFNEKYPHVKKFFDDRGIDFGKIREHSAKVIASSALAGTLLFTPPILSTNLPSPLEIIKTNVVSPSQALLTAMSSYLPQQVGPLDRSQEKNLEKIFSDIIGVSARGTLEGEHLNTTYGLIGAEQHLIRYPGDTLSAHDLVPNDEGMAPGLGAWGYFAPSKDQLTDQDIQNEKWYAVVQTLYLPDWDTRLSYLVNWYKYRKVLIVNTINGNAIVADIADSGPANFTGKQFGGSPAVMNYLGGLQYRKGPVIVFFVDDPENKVPLGPVDYNKI